MKYSLLVLAYLGLTSFNIYAAPLEIEVTNIRNKKGVIILSFYKDEASFDQYTPFLEQEYSKTQILDGSLIIKTDLCEGTYGIALLDDENNDGEMKYNIIGIPKEGFGFSNFILRRYVKPKLTDFEFIHNPNNKVLIQITYM